MSEQEVFDYIYSVITREYLENRIQKKENFGITAKDIADHFNTYRSTVSTMLNTAVKNGLFIKIETRPVLFVPVDIIKKELHVPLEKSVYTPEEIRDLFFKKEQEVDSFSIMIGYDGSQSLQIKQAQSAILYPPKGLHTLFEMQTLDFLHKQLVALVDILCQRHIKCPYKIRMQQAVAYLCYAGCRIAMSKNI